MAHKLPKKMIVGFILSVVLLLIINVSLGLAQTGKPEGGSEPSGDGLGEKAAQVATQTPFPTATPLPEVSNFQGQAAVSFLNLGEPTFELKYPSIKTMFVNYPDQWALAGGEGKSFLTIHYDLVDEWNYALLTEQFGVNVDISTLNLANLGHPGVDVYINDVYIGYFIPEVGQNHTATLAIPNTSFINRPANPGNGYDVRLEFARSYGSYCGYDGLLTVYDDSSVNVSYSQVPPFLSIDQFPQGILQNSIFPEKLYVIIPDQYTESDLQAAAIVGATIGKNSASPVAIEVAKASGVDTTKLANMSAIVVGQPTKNSFLTQLYDRSLMPSLLSPDRTKILYKGTEIGLADGILQEIPSDINNIYSYFVVSGSSDAGVVRAARGLANPLVVDLYGGVGLIKEANDPPVQEFDTNRDLYTLNDFGYIDRTYYGLSIYGSGFTFFVPRDWQLTENPSLVLNYAHSATLSPSGSSLNVTLNGIAIGSAPIDITKQGEKTVTIPLERTGILPGVVNVIRFEAILNGSLDCSAYESRSRWMTIRGTSQLSIPHTVITDAGSLAPMLQPVTYLANENHLMISMPPDPTPDELSTLANFAVVVGRQSVLSVPEISVSLDPQHDFSTDTNYNVLMIGKPTSNPQIARINDSLVQKFVPGEDTLQERVATTFYRVGEGSDLGVIEAIPAPWNAFKGVTVVTGTSDMGLNWAMEKVSSETFLPTMLGDLIFTVGPNINAFNSSQPMAVPLEQIVSTITEQTSVPVVVITPTFAVTQTISESDRYISTQAPANNQVQLISRLLLYGLVALAVIIVIYALARTIRGGRRR